MGPRPSSEKKREDSTPLWQPVEIPPRCVNIALNKGMCNKTSRINQEAKVRKPVFTFRL